MSMIVALDPNILVAALENHSNSRYAVELLISDRHQFCLGLDPAGEIWNSYNKLSHDLITNDITKSFVSLFLDRSQRRLSLISEASLRSHEIEWLDEKNCLTPVEPQLIAVAKAAASDSCMLVVGGSCQNTKLAQRGTDSADVTEWLHKTFRETRIYPVDTFSKMLTLCVRSRFPGNEAHLKQYIQDVENEFVEFKQPKFKDKDGIELDGNKLTSTIINDALEAVCAMVNTEGGKVMVGVNDQGKIIGIDPTDRRGNPINDDLLSRRFSDRFHHFEPSANQFVKPSVIPLSSGRRVVVLHVEKGLEGQRYKWLNQVYDRCGPSNRKAATI